MNQNYKAFIEEKVIYGLLELNQEHKLGFPDNIIRETTLEADLSLDSFGRIEVSMKIEDMFNIQIHQDDVRAWKTVGDIIDYILRVNPS